MAQAGTRPREARIRVMVPVRLNIGGRWADACIHNMSSRGLLIAMDDPPSAGSYVDIRRGTLVIIARVAWSKDRFFGVRTQDRISMDGLVNEPRRVAAPEGSAERRVAARHLADAAIARRIERHRFMSSLMQYGAISLAALIVAGFGANQLYIHLSNSLAPIRTALGG